MIRNATSSFVRTFAGTPATARTTRLSMPASAVHLLGADGASSASGRAMGLLDYGLSTAFDPAESTISHLPLIFCTLWLTETTFTTLAVFGSM